SWRRRCVPRCPSSDWDSTVSLEYMQIVAPGTVVSSAAVAPSIRGSNCMPARLPTAAATTIRVRYRIGCFIFQIILCESATSTVQHQHQREETGMAESAAHYLRLPHC